MSLVIDPLGTLRTATEKANALGNKIRAAKANPEEVVTALLETSDDEALVKFRQDRDALREEIETLQAKIVNGEAAAKDYAKGLATEVEKDFDVTKATEEFATLRRDANEAYKALLNFVSEEDLKAAMKEMGIVPVVSLKGSGKAAAAGLSGIKRPRISAATVDGKPVWKDEKEGKVDFTELAKVLKTDANTVKAAAFAAAQTDELNSLPVGHVVSFEVSGKKVTVTVSGDKPGRKAAEKPAEVPAAEKTSDKK